MAPTFKLMGGLGNQLFVYSAALYHAIESGQTVSIDPQFAAGASKGGNHHNLSSSLQKLHLDPRVRLAKPLENPMNAALNFLSDVRLRLFAKESGLLPTHGDCGGMGEAVSDKALYVRGYFQRHKYLEGLKRRQEWTTPQPKTITSEAHELGLRIVDQKGVILHVRRGDYTSLGSSFGVLGPTYYLRALESIEQSSGELGKVFIFSDEPSYVKTVMAPMLSKSFDVEVIKPMSSPEQDLYAMSQGSSFVLANSSFSWWAANLNSGPDTSVVAYPQPWFRTSKFSNDLFPESWLPVKSDWNSDD
ncbi:alpha-1,2-fucosyltransferase [Aquiluna sp.]|nr:alpha-1,2-fucosyltransferase [Aquiluna sp.]